MNRMQSPHSVLGVAHMLGRTLAVCGTGAFQSPRHAHRLATVLGEIQLATANHGSDAGVLAVLVALHESLVGFSIDHGPSASTSSAELGRSVSRSRVCGSTSAARAAEHLVPRGRQSTEAVCTIGGDETDHVHEVRCSTRDASRGLAKVHEEVLLHVEHDTADELHASSSVVSHLGSQTLEQGANKQHGLAQVDGHGVSNTQEHVDND